MIEREISEVRDLPVESQLNDWFSKPQSAEMLVKMAQTLKDHDRGSVYWMLDYRQIKGQQDMTLLQSLIASKLKVENDDKEIGQDKEEEKDDHITDQAKVRCLE